MIAKMNKNKKYQIIYADPPWRYNHGTPGREIERQYPTMTDTEICALDVPVDKDAILYLWATAPRLESALIVMKSWGFKYKTQAVWDKVIIGMGYWFRVCTEHLIVAVKGNVKAFRDMERTCYHEKRGKHSKKPEHFYQTIERVTTGNRIELFARQKREGWDVWGNEVDSSVAL